VIEILKLKIKKKKKKKIEKGGVIKKILLLYLIKRWAQIFLLNPK
jgi:hypothetical protein